METTILKQTELKALTIGLGLSALYLSLTILVSSALKPSGERLFEKGRRLKSVYNFSPVNVDAKPKQETINNSKQ